MWNPLVTPHELKTPLQVGFLLPRRGDLLSCATGHAAGIVAYRLCFQLCLSSPSRCWLDWRMRCWRFLEA